MRILHIIRSTHPSGGGPIAGIMLHNEATIVGRNSAVREIVTLDPPESPWLRSIPLKVHAVGSIQPAFRPSLPKLQKYGASGPLRHWLQQNAMQFDCAIIHGFWNATSLAAKQAFAQLELPYFIFAHGMLDPWFCQGAPAKHLTRMMSWKFIEGPLAARSQAVLFTSEVEMQRARTAFTGSDYRGAVVGYGTSDPGRHYPIDIKSPRQPYLLFLGRLHHKKGVDLILKALAEIQSGKRPQIKIAGPDEENRLLELKATAQQLGLAEYITWLGPVFGQEKAALMREAEAFILPSHQENFGIAVAEALATGTPVLMSDKVAIWESIENAGAGIVANDTVCGTKSLLLKWQAMPQNARYQMRQQARQLFNRKYNVANNAPALVRRLGDLIKLSHQSA